MGTSTGGVATCGDCRAPLINDGAKGCKVDAICVPSACREHHGASPDKPGAGSRDDDCCGRTGNTGCDVGYVHSQIKDAERAAGMTIVVAEPEIQDAMSVTCTRK